MNGYSETGRQLVHVAMAAFALLLRVFTWQQAALLASSAVLFNLFLLARIAPRIIRPAEFRSARPGVLFYPLSILTLVLLFRSRLDIVAAAWGVMAFGDGFATLVGTRVGGRTLPWNRRKTWSGLAAFVVAGGAGATALSVWVAPAIAPPPSLSFLIWTSAAGAIVAGLVETLPIGLDDNISVPAAAAATVWFCGLLAWPAGLDNLAADLATGILLSVPLALLTLRSKRVTAGGALTGLLCAGVIYAGAYLAGLAVLAVALGLTLASSRVGSSRIATLAVSGEIRAAGNIVANCLVGTLGALCERLSDEWSATATAVWFVTGIAAGASDTVASEIGKASSSTPRTFPTFRQAQPGTPGAVSLIGTAAGAVAAALIALPGAAMWLIPWNALPLIVMACAIGAFAESALSTAFEARGILDNNALNFINTAVAAAAALALTNAFA